MKVLKWVGAAIITLLILGAFNPQENSPSHPGAHKDADGKWSLNQGCHWVHPDDLHDLQAYCGERITSAPSAPAAPKNAIDSYFDRLDTWCYYHPHSWRC